MTDPYNLTQLDASRSIVGDMLVVNNWTNGQIGVTLLVLIYLLILLIGGIKFGFKASMAGAGVFVAFLGVGMRTLELISDPVLGILWLIMVVGIVLAVFADS